MVEDPVAAGRAIMHESEGLGALDQVVERDVSTARPDEPPGLARVHDYRSRTASYRPIATASCAPVDAPDGTAARPKAPDSSVTSTSTVGLPRLSRIWRAWMSTMAVMRPLPFLT